MEFITTIIACMIVGGIARAIVMFFREPRKDNAVFLKKFDNLKTLSQKFKKATFILQAIWLFWALLITNQYENSLLNLDTLIIFVGLSLPVIAFYSIKWIIQKDTWPIWILVLGSCMQIFAAVPLSDVIYSENLTTILIIMVIVFNVFYMFANFPVIWNELCDYSERKPKAIRKNILRACSIFLILLLGYSFWQDYKPPSKTFSAEYFSEITRDQQMFDAAADIP